MEPLPLDNAPQSPRALRQREQRERRNADPESHSLTFPTMLIGQSSTPQTATLTNTGTGPSESRMYSSEISRKPMIVRAVSRWERVVQSRSPSRQVLRERNTAMFKFRRIVLAVHPWHARHRSSSCTDTHFSLADQHSGRFRRYAGYGHGDRLRLRLASLMEWRGTRLLILIWQHPDLVHDSQRRFNNSGDLPDFRLHTCARRRSLQHLAIRGVSAD